MKVRSCCVFWLLLLLLLFLSTVSLILDYVQASTTFSVVRNMDPYRTTNMDTFSDVLFVMVSASVIEYSVILRTVLLYMLVLVLLFNSLSPPSLSISLSRRDCQS